MNRSKMKYGCFLGIMMLCFVACQREDTKSEKESQVVDSLDTSSTEPQQETESKIEGKLSENVVSEISEIPIYEKEQGKIEVQVKELDLEEVKKILYPDHESTGQVEQPYEGVESLTTEDGLFLIKDENIVSAETAQWDPYNDFIGLRQAVELETSFEEELAFLSREMAEKQVRELVSNLDISFAIDDIQIEAYTAEYLTNLSAALQNHAEYAEFLKPETKERRWEEADEMYYVQVGFQENGIPIDREGYTLNDDTDIQGMQLQLYLTEQGIQYFMVERAAFMDKQQEERIEVCDVQTGLEAVLRKYENIIMEETVILTGAQLEYSFLPDSMTGKIYLTPVIKFDLKIPQMMYSEEKPEGEQIQVEEAIRIDAQTGRLIE